MNVRILLLALPAFCAATCFASVESLSLPEKAAPGLEPILQNAVRQSPRMVSRALDLEMAENNRISARAGLLPNIGGYVRITETRDKRADVAGSLEVSKTYYDVSLNQPIFFWGERRNTARIGEISKMMAERNYREGYRQLAQEIRQKYLTLIVQKTVVARAQRFQAHAERELKLGEERLANKVISELQIHPIRLTAEQGQIALERAEFDFDNAKRSLARLAGIAEIRDEQIPDEVPLVHYNQAAIEQLLAVFLGHREVPTPEAANMRSQLEIERYNHLNQKTRLRPKFSFIFGLNQDEQAYTLNTAQKYRVDSLYAGISASWTLFDGFAARSGQRNALARRRQLEIDYSQLNERLSEQAQTQAKQLNFAARSMSISNRFLDSGHGAVRSKREDFARGIASETDIALAEIALFDARINAYNQRLDFMLKTGDFLGTIAEDPAVANLSAK